jgi:hypothetical protein
MAVRLHPHALERLQERGGAEQEVRLTVETGERFEAKFGRTGFRRNFPFAGTWQGEIYANRQIEAYAVQEGSDWVVITVIVKYF